MLLNDALSPSHHIPLWPVCRRCPWSSQAASKRLDAEALLSLSWMPHSGWGTRLSGINYCASCTTNVVEGTEILLGYGFNASKTLALFQALAAGPPPGHGDMMIERLSLCEQEAGHIRRSGSQTKVSQCEVSLKEKWAERREVRNAFRWWRVGLERSVDLLPVAAVSW